MRLFIFLLALFSTSVVWASGCHGKIINPATDLCWSCLFPLSIGGAKMVGSKVPDTPNPKNPICVCRKGNLPQVGLAVGLWEPARLIEVVRKPYCFPTLGGLSLGHAPKKQGTVSDEGRSFYNVHYYIYPVLNWLNILADGLCAERADLDIAYLSELDPSWNDPALSFILNPEAVLFSNPAAITACAADCVKASTSLPSNLFHWCAGCQGAMFPLTGHVQAQYSGVQGSLLLTQRVLYRQHRLLNLSKTAGTDNHTLCHKTIQPLMKKSQYRTQMVYPISVTTASRGGCMPLGRTTTTWEANKQFPIKGEDFAYLIFRKRNCCAL